MKLLFWNARGIGNLDTRLVLKKLCNLHKPDLHCIIEPWIVFKDVPSNFFKSIHLRIFAENDRGSLLPNLWCF